MYEPPHERPHVHSHRTPRIPQATGRPTLSCPLLSPYFSLFPLHLLCLLVNLMGFPLKTCSHILPSAVGWIKFRPSCTVLSHGPMRNIGFLGRWGTYACPQCLPSGTVPIRSWTRTLRPPGIRHRHLPYHTIPPCCIPHRISRTMNQFSSERSMRCCTFACKASQPTRLRMRRFQSRIPELCLDWPPTSAATI